MMSNNPFDKINDESSFRGGSYSSLVKKQVLDLEIEQCVKADLLGRSASNFRSTLSYVASNMGAEFKTRKNCEGEIWIKRIR